MVLNSTGSMLHLFLGLKSLVRVRRHQTDCSVFRLHYKATVMCLLGPVQILCLCVSSQWLSSIKSNTLTMGQHILLIMNTVFEWVNLAFTFIVTSRQYVGTPIMCVHTNDVPQEVLNTYCWIHPTYTLSSAHWKRVGVDVPHPGVDKTRDEKDKKHVKYYQWVGFLLFLQVR